MRKLVFFGLLLLLVFPSFSSNSGLEIGNRRPGTGNWKVETENFCSSIFSFSCPPSLISLLQPAVSVYKNEVIKNGADPYVFRDNDGKYYLYHTGKGFPVYTSTDLVNWEPKGKSMPVNGYKWAKSRFWAPEVVKIKDQYYLHYTGASADGILRIGLAKADSPLGPFTDVNEKPFFETGNKGVLDSDLFFDESGKVYLYYSSAMSTNIVGDQRFSEIWVVEVNPDLSGIKGRPVLLLKPEQNWEYNGSKSHFWNEGSAVFKKNGIYYLMYSANCYCSQSYSIGYASSKSPLGPFVKYEKNPILSNEPFTQTVSGPGHHAVTYSPDGKEMMIIYHSHRDVLKGGGQRKINIDRMGIRADGTVYANGPTVTLQPVPSSKGNPLQDITNEAAIMSSSTLPGYKTESLKDGEFSMYPRFKEYEWVGSGTDKDYLEISFLWERKQKIDEIWIYNSIDSGRQAFKGFVVSDKGDSIQNIVFNKLPGEATIIKFQGIEETKGLKLFLNTDRRPEIALSEIKIFALKNN
jgi:GH43 family beta-xylosidase